MTRSQSQLEVCRVRHPEIPDVTCTFYAGHSQPHGRDWVNDEYVELRWPVTEPELRACPRCKGDGGSQPGRQGTGCSRCQGKGFVYIAAELPDPHEYVGGRNQCEACGYIKRHPVHALPEVEPPTRLPQPGEIWTNKRNKVRIVTLAQENSSGWEVVVYSYGMGIPSYTDLDDFLERFTRVLEAPTDTKDDNE